MTTIDFHSEASRGTYAWRDADNGWAAAMAAIDDPAGKRVADIGCGGGIYLQAWRIRRRRGRFLRPDGGRRA